METNNNYEHIEVGDIVAPPSMEAMTSVSALPEQQQPFMEPPVQQERPRVIFCLPGREYSRHFLISWTRLLITLMNNGIDIVLSQNANSMVHFARSQCLGGDNRKGKDQKPFQGQVPYHFLIWIDSDIAFNPEDIIRLLRSPHPVTAGYYRMENSQSFAAVKTWDEDYFEKNGSFEFITEAMIHEYRETTNQQYMQVDYSGMGMMCFKYGVLECLEYPWFTSPIIQIKDFVDITAEDVSLAKKLKEKGIPIMLDTEVRVGHVKSVIL